MWFVVKEIFFIPEVIIPSVLLGLLAGVIDYLFHRKQEDENIRE